MDSLTQAVLGAAVGEAAGGKALGRRAALWGAVAGTLPDLDILAYPFLDPVGELRFHRGITHALVFAPVVAPLLGAALARWYRARGRPALASARAWAAVCFWALFTHPLLDAFTVYGTQLFQPFSDYPAALSSVFIIDPLYTLPLVAGLVGALGWRSRRAVGVGLALSTAYLGWSLVAQQAARGAVERSLAAQGVAAERVLVTPAPLTTLLWRATADAGDHFLVGHRSLFDGERPVRFEAVPKHAERLDPYRGSRALDALTWFSRGWLAVVGEAGGAPVAADLRFGRTDAGLTPGTPGAYVFAWRLVRHSEPTFEQVPVEARLPPDFFRRLLGRIAGREPPDAPGVPSAPPVSVPRPRAAPP